MQRVTTHYFNALFDAAKRAGREEAFAKKFLNNVPRDKEIFQVAGVAELSAEWLRAKEEFIKRAPTRKRKLDPIEAVVSYEDTLPESWDGLLTVMSRLPKPHGYPPSVREERRHPDPSRLQKLAAEIFPRIAFTGATMKREASTGMPFFERDYNARVATLARGYSVGPMLRKYGDSLENGKVQFQAMKDGLMFAPFNPVERRQPAAYGKEYRTYTFSGEEVVADRSIPELGKRAVTCRRRVPTGGPGSRNLPFAIDNAGLRSAAEREFPSIFKHRGPDHLAEKLNSFAAGRKLYFVALDISQMEYSMHTEYVRQYLTRFDELFSSLGRGFARVMSLNAPTAVPIQEDRFPRRTFGITHEGNFDSDANFGLGMRSGDFTVTDCNKLAGTDCVLETLRNTTGEKWALRDVESGPRVRLFNLGDDNLIATPERALAEKLRDALLAEPVHAGFKTKLEPMPVFLKYVVMLIDGKYRFVKVPDTAAYNILCSEYGQQYLDSDVFDLDEAVPTTVGYYLRQIDYADNPVAVEVIRLLEEVLTSSLGKPVNELFPVDQATLSLFLKSESAGENRTVDGWMSFLALNLDYIYYRATPDEIPEEVLDALYLHISADRYDQLNGVLIPRGEPLVHQPYEEWHRAIRLKAIADVQSRYLAA